LIVGRVGFKVLRFDLVPYHYQFLIETVRG
jgi:hypothetical protein